MIGGTSFEGIDEKFLVWCTISAKRIFGPYLFEESLNQQNYLKMLKSFYSPKLQHTTDYRIYYFQQNGTATYTANMVQKWLGDHLSTKFIDKKM